MKRTIILVVVCGVLGLGLGYLIFGRTPEGYVGLRALLSPSKNALDELVKTVMGIKKMRQAILISGGVGAWLGLVIGVISVTRPRRRNR
jgi:hypothetical protein